MLKLCYDLNSPWEQQKYIKTHNKVCLLGESCAAHCITSSSRTTSDTLVYVPGTLDTYHGYWSPLKLYCECHQRRQQGRPRSASQCTLYRRNLFKWVTGFLKMIQGDLCSLFLFVHTYRIQILHSHSRTSTARTGTVGDVNPIFTLL